MNMSLPDKLQTPISNQPVPGVTAPIAPRPEIMAPAPRPRVAQGLKRRQYTKAHHSLDNVQAVSLWASERIIPSPGNCIYVGGKSYVTPVTNSSGRKQRVVISYDLPTLRDDFAQFCAQRSWALPPMKTFSGLILKHCVERGIPARADRTHRERRKIIVGITLVGHTIVWDGNERNL